MTSHTPADTAALLASQDTQAAITVWGSTQHATATRYVDDVRMTPVR